MSVDTQVNQATESKFDIRNHLDKLEKAQGKNKYYCPVCKGNDLSIEPKTGMYKCFHGCESKDIREAVSPWKGRKKEDKSHRETPKPKLKYKPAPLPDSINLVRLAARATDRPQRVADFDKTYGDVNVLTYYYSESQWIRRTEWSDREKRKGYSKKFCQMHRNEAGQVMWNQGDKPWQPYRIDEAIAAIKADESTNAKGLLLIEGEECVEEVRSIALAGTTVKGDGWKEENLIPHFAALKELNVVLIFVKDNDNVGTSKANVVSTSCNKVGLPCIIIDPVAFDPDLPEKGDVVDVLANMNPEEFIKKLEEQIHQAIEERSAQKPKESAQDGKAETSSPEPENKTSKEDEQDEWRDNQPESDWSQDFETEANQLALKFHYIDSEHSYISHDDKLYQWVGTHFEECPDVLELKKISSYLNTFRVVGKKGQVRYPYANPHKVREVLNWVKMRLTVDPKSINPPGLNCSNGVLQIHWDKDKPSWELIPHDPNLHYLYEPYVEYNPNANPENCDRLLQVLEPAQREIFLRTIAASLDLATVRKYKGRLVRALLLKGHGANGKDALREAVSTMYGHQAICSASVSDFAEYDRGRKFTLARTDGARVNWSSENANFAKIDTIQSLKSFISGDPISRERKGKDEVEFTPKAITLFNVNDVPNMQGSQEAILSRYGVLLFNKTFKVNADPEKGELEADPRFKYDPDFLRNDVLPAFLNQVLAALSNLMKDGIDYRCTEEALRDIQRENSHLHEFCQITGLNYKPGSSLSAQEIYEPLQQWYIDTGTVVYEDNGNGKQKASWTEQASKHDRNVKGPNQVIARFQEIFPKAKRGTGDKGKPVLLGIGFFGNKNDGTDPPNNRNNPPSVPPHDGNDPLNDGNNPSPPQNHDGDNSPPPQNNDENLRGSCKPVAGQCAWQQPLPDIPRGAIEANSQLVEKKEISSSMSQSFCEPKNLETEKEEQLPKLTQLPRQLDIASVIASATAPLTAPQVTQTAPQAKNQPEASEADIADMANDIKNAKTGIMYMVLMDMYCIQYPQIRDRILGRILSADRKRLERLQEEAQDKAKPGDKCKVQINCGKTFDWFDAKFVSVNKDPKNANNITWAFELEDGQSKAISLRSEWLLLEPEDGIEFAECAEFDEAAEIIETAEINSPGDKTAEGVENAEGAENAKGAEGVEFSQGVEFAEIGCPWEEIKQNGSLTSEK